MGIVPTHIKLMVRMRDSFPFRGRVLTIGKQTVYADSRTCLRILRAYGVDDAGCAMIGGESLDADDRAFVAAEVLLKALGATEVVTLGASAYEGAEIVHDLNRPVLRELTETCDVLMDFGCLEHIFDVRQVLANYVSLVRVGGHVVLHYPCSGAIDHGFYSISPTLLYDFFAANGFGEMKCFLLVATNKYSLFAKQKVYRYDGVGMQLPLMPRRPAALLFFARKTARVETLTVPTQTMYRQMWGSASQAPRPAFRQRSWLRKLLSKVNRWTMGRRPECVDRLVSAVLFDAGRDRGRNVEYLGCF